MRVTHTRVGYADLERWPEDGQIVSANLHLAWTNYVREYDVMQPDLLLFTRERQQLVNLRRVPRSAPDLAIEILSPSTATNDRGRKMQLLAQRGVQEYWLVDPDAVRIEVDWLSGEQFLTAATATGAEAVRSPLLPALVLRPVDVVPDSTNDTP